MLGVICRGPSCTGPESRGAVRYARCGKIRRRREWLLVTATDRTSQRGMSDRRFGVGDVGDGKAMSDLGV